MTRPIFPPLLLGDVAIDRYSYYAAGDVLYLTAGPPRPAADDDDSLERHTIFFDAHGDVIGLTVIGAREHLDLDGTLNVTLRDGGPSAQFPRAAVEPLLVETIRY